MLNAEQCHDAPMSAQVLFWNRWNTDNRDDDIWQVSADQRRTVVGWLDALHRRDLKILEVGCGTGWLCTTLAAYGTVTGTDLSHECLQRAAARLPGVKFVAGDFMSLAFDDAGYDVIVCLEVLSHVADQPAFARKLASLLKPGGHLMLGTQNRPQLERNDIPPPNPGQIRQWVDRHQLTRLLAPHFAIEAMSSTTPQFNRGLLRFVNSAKLHKVMTAAGLGAASRAVKRVQEKAWMGWTLMCLAQKPAANPASD